MNIGVLTSLYPAVTRPHEGIFAERRWLGMQDRGHEVRVIQPLPMAPPFVGGRWAAIAACPEHEERSGIPVHRPRYVHLPRGARGNARRFAATGLRALLSDAAPKSVPDIVVCDYAWPAAAAAPELASRGIACLISGRGSDVLQVSGEAQLGDELAAFLRAAGHWCAVSQDLVETMDRLAGAPGVGVLVPNGVDLDAFRPGDRCAAREALGLGLGAEGKLVLVVGHLIPRKDPVLALEAFRHGAPSDASLVFLGRGELEPKLRAVADERVQVRGEVGPAELGTWYAAADALLLTSRREGRPNVVLEALACGRPVYATDAGGTAELLVGADEMLARTRDPEALGRGLASLLASPPTPERCRGLIEHLSWDRSLDTLEAVLIRAAGALAG